MNLLPGPAAPVWYRQCLQLANPAPEIGPGLTDVGLTRIGKVCCESICVIASVLYMQL